MVQIPSENESGSFPSLLICSVSAWMPFCSPAQDGAAGQILICCWCCGVRSPAYLAQAGVISPLFSNPSQSSHALSDFWFAVVALLGLSALQGKQTMLHFPLELVSFLVAFSPLNVAVVHLVKATEGMRRSHILQLQNAKSAGPRHADFSSEAAVRQCGHALLYPPCSLGSS